LKQIHNFKNIKFKNNFNNLRYPELAEVYSNPNTYVLYPSQTAISLQEFRDLIDNKEKEEHTPNNGLDETTTDERMFHVILIDGTWAQASGIYYTNYDLHKLKQVNKIWNMSRA
jgi:DTW domain-containing protein YfiP